ncbi:hypothetical protein BGW80DRAFT_1354476, partial [Lactifluus volemus]
SNATISCAIPLPIILFLRSIVELKPWDTTSSFSLICSVPFPTVRILGGSS